MAFSAGTRLGPYEILGPLGAGGMGEVYRARDSRLKRDVAIKVVPDLFSSDPGRLTRFTREAEFLATLNHPNIAAVHGLEESNGVRAIVLELVEGDTLADVIARGPIALEDALPIATQIARALEAAHEKGIIHRDLKPANIKLRTDGTVKVLDFGLAKSFEQTLPGDLTRAALVESPAATVAGVILGTAAYMSPEQARGKALDKRTDIWAFGCVLFEMLAGKRPFEGETLTDTIAAIVKNEPDWRALPHGTPAAVRWVIARCLKKDPAERLRDIGDGRFQLEDPVRDPGGAAVVPTPVPARREWVGWIAAVLMLGVALLFALRPSPSVPAREPVSFQVFPPDKMSFSTPVNVSVPVASFAVSPDGRTLVFSAEAPGGAPTLWLRSLDQVTLRQLPGTDGAEAPFWSPDSHWIAFVADRKLKKIAASGGAVQVISDVPTDFRGGSWGPGDTVLFGSVRLPISSVSASGGKPTALTVLDRSKLEASHRYPEILPDARHFVYVIFSGNRDRNGLYAESLEGGSKKFLGQLNASAVYVPPGFMLFVERNALLGQAFDTERLELTGQRFLVAERVARSSAWLSAVSASRTGTIAFAGNISQHGRLMWFDRSGRTLEPPPTPEGDYADFRLSPDEQQLSASLVNPETNALETWFTDLVRGARSVLPSGGSVTAAAIWSADGADLMFRTNRNGAIEFHQRSAQGGGSDRIVLSSAELPATSAFPTDWSRDGRHVVFSASPESDYDLWLMGTADRKPTKLISAPADQMHGNFSPDGHLLAYTSNETGRFEVYVETLPRSDHKWPVSTNGGYEPRWRVDGRELYYLSEDRKLMVVPVGAGPSFGIPKPLFQTQVRAGVTSFRTHYVPSRDGQRFLVNTAIDVPPSPITVIVNWTAALKK
jgi:Tol biopolymer transport system component